jgi:hypothetical protein
VRGSVPGAVLSGAVAGRSVLNSAGGHRCPGEGWAGHTATVRPHTPQGQGPLALRAGGHGHRLTVAAARRIERLIDPPLRSSGTRRAVTYAALATMATLAVTAFAFAISTIIRCPGGHFSW